ncbi:hypothetical protein Tco_0156764 [Tanacetum coccineum]
MKSWGSDLFESAQQTQEKYGYARKQDISLSAEEIVVDELANSINIYAEWGQKLKDPTVEDPTQKKQAVVGEGLSNAHNKHFADSNSDSYTVLYSSCSEESENETDDADDSDIDLSDDNPQGDNDVVKFGEGSSNAHNKHYADSDTNSNAILYFSCSEESKNETDDADNSDMDLSDDNPQGDDDAAGFGVFMYNKSTETPNSTYFSPTVTSSLLDFIQDLLNETHANELTDLVSNLVYTDAQITSAVIYTEGNPELTSYIPGASEVPLGTHVDVQAINVLLQEMFPDENAHYKPSLPAKKIPYNATTPQPSSLQAKAKKLMQGKEEYKEDCERIRLWLQEAVQVRVLTEIKKILPTDIPKALANYVKPHLNTSVLEAHDNQDPPNNHEGENRKKHQKDVGKPSSKSSRRNKSPMVHAQDDTPAIQLVDQEDEYIRTEWYTKSDLEGARLERLKQQYQNDVKLEYHVGQLKATVLLEAKWTSDEDDVSKAKMRSDDQEYEFSYTDLPRLSLNDISAPIIDQRIPFTMIATHKEVVYINQHNVKSLMRLSKVNKFCDGMLVKIWENLIDMVTKNKLVKGNTRLKGRDGTDNDVMKSNEMVNKIDKTLKLKEQLRRLKEYVRGRPKTVNPCTFVRPM